MADGTGIEWTDATWGPLVGCTKVSPGCDNCYAEKVVNRWNAAGNPAFPLPFDVVHVRDDRLHLYEAPLRWTRPRRIFVNSLSDLFHKDVPDETVADIFAIMSMAPQHTFQLLTKRHARMHSLLSKPMFKLEVNVARLRRGVSVLPDSRRPDGTYAWPLPNLWLGVSVEDQHWADIRIPALLDTPAAVRWISAEPLLGPIDLRLLVHVDGCTCGPGGLNGLHEPGCGSEQGPGWGLDWVVAGGESGPQARPMHPSWGAELRDQCAAAGVPFLWKQWGNWAPLTDGDRIRERTDAFVAVDGTARNVGESVEMQRMGAVWMRRMSKHAAGRHLEGKLHDGYPTVAHPVYTQG